VTNSFINNNIFFLHQDSQIKSITAKTYFRILNAYEMRVEDVMLPGKMSGIPDLSAEGTQKLPSSVSKTPSKGKVQTVCYPK
jgi:hypothetical protein